MAASGCKKRNESMPPKLDAKSATERVHFMAPQSLLDRIMEWRAAQRPVATQSDALRRLVEESLERWEKAGKPIEGDIKD